MASSLCLCTPYWGAAERVAAPQGTPQTNPLMGRSRWRWQCWRQGQRAERRGRILYAYATRQRRAEQRVAADRLRRARSWRFYKYSVRAPSGRQLNAGRSAFVAEDFHKERQPLSVSVHKRTCSFTEAGEHAERVESRGRVTMSRSTIERHFRVYDTTSNVMKRVSRPYHVPQTPATTTAEG
jgi:hypothetical protein